MHNALDGLETRSFVAAAAFQTKDVVSAGEIVDLCWADTSLLEVNPSSAP